MEKISTITPVYNESSNVTEFYRRLKAVLNNLNYDHEIVFINDGSKDNSLNILLDIQKSDEKVKVIDFSRNFGKEIALTAGINTCTGDIAIPIDADLQEPPEVIPKLLEMYEQGYEVINAARRSRKESFIKNITSKVFYKFFNSISPIAIPENVSDFRLISKTPLNYLKELSESNRFNKGLFAWIGFKSCTIFYDADKRLAGNSKFNFRKLVNLAFEGITSFSITPLRLISLAGATLIGASLLYIIIELIKPSVVIYQPLVSIILCIGGLQLVSLGLAGEYIGRIYMEVKKRPLYVIRKIYTGSGDDTDGKITN